MMITTKERETETEYNNNRHYKNSPDIGTRSSSLTSAVVRAMVVLEKATKMSIGL